MSLQELHIRALEDQVVNLTRDCHYLMSLLNTDGNIDWDSWPQGQKIKEDLERSKDFFDAIKRRQKPFSECARGRQEKIDLQRRRNENARRAKDLLRQCGMENEISAKTEYQPSRAASIDYTIADGLRDIFQAFDTFRFF